MVIIQPGRGAPVKCSQSRYSNRSLTPAGQIFRIKVQRFYLQASLKSPQGCNLSLLFVSLYLWVVSAFNDIYSGD